MKQYEAPEVYIDEFANNDVMTASVPFEEIEDNPDE